MTRDVKTACASGGMAIGVEDIIIIVTVQRGRHTIENEIGIDQGGRTIYAEDHLRPHRGSLLMKEAIEHQHARIVANDVDIRPEAPATAAGVEMPSTHGEADERKALRRAGTEARSQRIESP